MLKNGHLFFKAYESILKCNKKNIISFMTN